jgi:uncharacterized protein (TIGR02145 family)
MEEYLLTEKEVEIIKLAGELFDKCNELTVMRDDDMKRISDAIHTIQHTVMIRPTRRNHKNLFPYIKNGESQKELTQDIFKDQPPEVDWCGVDYDGDLNFGRAINPRYTWESERWYSFKKIGETWENTYYKPLTSLRREKITDKDTVTLIGLEWDKANIEGYYNFHEANKVAEDSDKRLPTKEEFERLSELPHVWDKKRRGMWFAEDKKDLKNPDKSLFLPVTGYRKNPDGQVLNQDSYGDYWSSTPHSSTTGYHLFFHVLSQTDYVYPSYNNNYVYGFPVRCVNK